MSPKINPGATDGRNSGDPADAGEALLAARLRDVYGLFEQAPGSMVLFTGPNHVVEMANPAYFAFTGLTRDILGRPAREGLKRGYARGFGPLLDAVYKGGECKVVRHARLLVTRYPGGPDEEAYGDFVLQPLRDADGQVYGVFLQGHEVTREKLAANELRASREALEQALAAEQKMRQAQKMEALGRLTGGIAHDFNNLLAVIIGSAEMLADALPGQPDLQGLSETILNTAERGAELVARLLAFARSQPLTPRPVDCAAFLAELLPILKRTLGDDIELVVETPAEPLACLADPSQLTSAVLNLAINARDAMPDGGRLTLSAAPEPAADGPDVAVIAVTDTGEGMTDAVRARALEPFFTTKAEGRGTGLGLSMAHGFVSQSGGRLDICSEPGRGTRVALRLPTANAAAVADAPSPASAEPLHDRHVLLVEDDDLLRDQVARQLTALGCRVTACADGHDALRRLGEAADIDLLMSDMVMPGGMNGRQLADHARLLHPSLKVLFTSGHVEEPLTRALRLDGTTGFLPKPYRRAELARKLAEVCAA